MTSWLKAFVAVAACAMSVTLVSLTMRDVMEIGGACGDGGPYVYETPCPNGSWLIFPGALGALFFAGLTSTFLGRFAASYAGLGLLAWPATFGALAWNFLDFGIDPPGSHDGLVWGWLICGVLFVGMAAGPLAIAGRKMLPVLWPPRDSQPAARGVRDYARLPNIRPVPAASLLGRDDDVAARLERVALLHRTGELDAAEFAAAKKAILGD